MMTYENFWIKIGNYLTGYRYSKAMNRKDFAEYCGVGETTIVKMETGKTNFSVGTLLTIADRTDGYIFYILLKAYYGDKLLKLLGFDHRSFANKVVEALLSGLIGDNNPKDLDLYKQGELRFPSRKTKDK